MYIHVKVTAGAKKETIEKRSTDSYRMSVREKAERNLANGAVLKALAFHLKMPLRKLRIVSGHHSPSKIISIEE